MVVRADSAWPLGAHTCRLPPGHPVQEVKVTVLRPGCSSGPRAGSRVRTPICDWAKRGQAPKQLAPARHRLSHLGTILIFSSGIKRVSQAEAGIIIQGEMIRYRDQELGGRQTTVQLWPSTCRKDEGGSAALHNH